MTSTYDYGTMTIVMQQMISKSQFKAHALEYLRNVEKKQQVLIVTHAGKPVAKVIPFTEEPLLKSLMDTVLEFSGPTEPVGQKDWKSF